MLGVGVGLGVGAFDKLVVTEVGMLVVVGMGDDTGLFGRNMTLSM
jgi:hypothetical protein